MDTRKKNEGKAHRTDSLTIDASELKFQDLISQVPVPITIFQGPSYIVTTINKTALGIWGKSYEQVLNKALFEVSPELEDGLKKILNDIYAAGKPYTTNEIEVQLKRNGKPDSAYFNTVYQPLRDLDHKIYGIIVIGTEVTEVVNARKQIEESEKRFSNILSQSVMSIGILKGTDMVVTFANEPLLATWGKGKDVIGKTLLQVLPEITGLGFIELLQQVYNTGVPYYGYEIKVTLIRNGKTEELYHNFVYQPYRDVDDSITGVTILATEVTEKVLIKKQIEENDEEIKRIASHLKLATDSAKVGIWSLDIVSSKLEWSNIHKTMWGYDAHREDLTYEDWHKVILPADKEIAFQKLKDAKVNHNTYEVEYRIIRANDGAELWIKSTGQYLYNEFGVAHTLTGISIDISEQKKSDAELTEAKSKAESALESKQQFLANMSHEIRTPMTAIVGFTKVLLKTDLSKQQKEYLKAVKTSGDALIVLINDILDLAKVDAGKMTFEETPFTMDLSISNILQLFDLKSKEKNLALIKEYDKNIPDLLLGDAMRLQQIIINLLSNALKFITKGQIKVMVRLLKEDKDNVTIEFAISDTGIGIAEDKIESIFENFQQATSSTSRIYGGTGLGLAICKQLVEKQGGTISVNSKVNEGSTFSFTLTFKKALTEIKLTDTEVILDNEINNIKVLVVEDVKLNQMLMRIILDDFQFKYDIADNGKVAVEKMQTETYDIILMDLQMPEMDGFEATEYIRNTLNSTVPIIALTADVTTVDVEKCKVAGMNDYIPKPLDERILYSKIVSLLKN